MKHEVRAIPPAPRHIRLRPLFAHRWPLFALGAIGVVLGSLLAWLMFLQGGGKASLAPRLDRGPTRSVQGTVHDVGRPFAVGGRELQHVRYRFPWLYAEQQSTTGAGESFLPPGRVQRGDSVEIEVLLQEPNVSRIRGGLVYIDRAFLQPRFWLTLLVAPGALFLLGWLAGLFQLRQVLVHGDVSIGHVERVAPVRFLVPEMLRVDYTFRDHRAAIRHQRHWVRRHGDLGVRLAMLMQNDGHEDMPVLHDRRLPQWNRMVVPADFPPQAQTSKATPHGVP
jgi:hypothetical protein